MTAVLAVAESSPPELPLDPPQRPSGLDQLIASVWEGLATRGTVECPVCGGHMEPEHGAGARPIGGRCANCGSILS